VLLGAVVVGVKVVVELGREEGPLVEIFEGSMEGALVEIFEGSMEGA